MTAEQITTIITNLFTSGGVAVFFYFVVRSLKQEISGLNKTIEAQNKTLEVMEKRIAETERVGDIYKGLITELPEYIDQYKKVIQATKDSVISELEQANQAKDEKLKETRELELKRLELQEDLLAELPKLREELLATTTAIQDRVEALLPAKRTSIVVTSAWKPPEKDEYLSALLERTQAWLRNFEKPLSETVIEAESVDVDSLPNPVDAEKKDEPKKE